ncbi:MAG: trypsin-like peptidase domain-containing protein [Myxococcales bacterium]|nr:trypsin-like peptidase domain-containing protein [Myxococcales bacterium]
MRIRLQPASFAFSVALCVLAVGVLPACKGTRSPSARKAPASSPASNPATSAPPVLAGPSDPATATKPSGGIDLAAASLPAALTPNQQSRRTPVVDAVHRAAPSVVSIFSEQKPHPQYNPFGFFGLEEDDDSGRTSLGSGVIVDPRGLVVTNEHVVAGAARIRVLLADGRELPATLVGADQSFDLAVLKIESSERASKDAKDAKDSKDIKDLPSLKIGTASDLMIGETVIAIGNPFGLSHTVTSGVISALHRVVRAKNRTYEDFIQIDAQINPGNSGGPLLNVNGELIGINTAVHSGGPGIGFAIPIDRARTIVNDLLQFGRVRYGFIGLRVAPIHERRRQATGVIVTEVDAGSPAEKAGIQPGDVVTHLGDEATVTVERFWDRVHRILAGEEVRVRLTRGEVSLRTTALDAKEMSQRARKRLGLEVVDAQGRAALVSRVNQGSIADRIGFQPGDAILQIGARQIRSATDFYGALGELRPGTDTVMLVVRGQTSYYVTVPF